MVARITSRGKTGTLHRKGRGRRRVHAAVMAALVSPLVGPFATPALADGAQVTRVTTSSTPISDTGLTDDCRAGITGTLSGTEDLAYQRVATASGVEIHGTIVDSIHIDWSDGTYSTGGSIDHFSFHDSAVSTVFTNAHEDDGSTYGADGTLLFQSTFHLVERFTVADGVVRVQFERGHLHFFGNC